MSDISMMQTTGDIGTKNVTINSCAESMSDVQAGIDFIYHMREHLIDIGIASVYAFVCYAVFLWITKTIKG